MFIVESYGLAVALCWVTMLCWGSWGNTQKLAAKTWRYELFYWDYVIGIVLFSLIWGLTLGSTGEAGRGFIQDLLQVSPENFWSAFLGGVIFNASNILLSASMSLAGMSVAFPVGVGLALVLGTVMGGRLHVQSALAAVVMLYLAFICGAGYILWALLMKNNPVSRIAIFGFVNPVVNVLLSAVLNGEPLFRWQYLAALVFVCVGIWLVNKAPAQKEKV